MRETGANYGRLAPDQHLTIKDKPVSARVSGEQAEQIEFLADASNMTMSTYLRLILQKAIDEAHRLDCGAYDVTVQLANGSYAGAVVGRPLIGGGTRSSLRAKRSGRS